MMILGKSNAVKPKLRVESSFGLRGWTLFLVMLAPSTQPTVVPRLRNGRR